MSKTMLADINDQLRYGPANINGFWYRNASFSLINEKRIFIRTPFPFTLFMKPVYIPWSEVREVKIIKDLYDSKPDFLSRMFDKFTSGKFLKIHLMPLNDHLLILPLKDSSKGHIPLDKISE